MKTSKYISAPVDPDENMIDEGLNYLPLEQLKLCWSAMLGAANWNDDTSAHPQRRRCKWKRIGVSSWDSEEWYGGCDVVWQFEEGGPAENEMRFCPKCGGKLLEQSNG